MERSQKAMKKFGHRWVKIWMSWMLLSNARKKEQAFSPTGLTGGDAARLKNTAQLAKRYQVI